VSGGVRSDPEAIEALAEQVRYHRDRYYNEQPEITDAEFDALEDRLRALAPEHPVLAEVGAAPVADAALDAAAEAEAQALSAGRDASRLAEQLEAEAARAYAGRPGDPRHYKGLWLAVSRLEPAHPSLARVPPPQGLEWPKARHELPMGSLNKVNTEQELEDWAARCDELAKKAELPPISGHLALTEKLDGISVEVVYADGRLEAGITRGDGVVGERITANVLQMQGVPEKIRHPGRISVRGEIILRKRDGAAFEAFKRGVDKRFEQLKSLRNTAAGIARTKDAKLLAGCRHLTILFYDLEGLEGLASERDKLAFLKDQGFATPSMMFGDTQAILAEHRRYAAGARAALDYDIDGLVVRADDLNVFTLLGELNHRPRAAVAYKFGNEMMVTGLLGIQWSTGDTGRITPIAQIEPVFLAGAEVRQASLHNAAKVQAMEIGVGDQVLVSRRNDVIPYVEKVVVKGPNREQPPATCGACGLAVAVDGEYLLCVNEACPARRVGRLKTWIKHLGLMDWGDKTLERFYETGLAREPADLYRLTVADIQKLSGFAEVSARKLLDPLNAAKQIPITTFIAALGIQSVSRETAKLLIGAGYDDFDKIAEASVEALSEIEGLGAIKAEKIITGMKARLGEIARLAEVGVVPVRPAEGGPLAGLSFCFSGAQTRPRKELELLVEKNGGAIRSGVTKGLSYLVLADPDSTSSKAQKAKKLGTEIIDGAGFEEIVRSRGGTLEL
jgi:DNA ligase (NAD+)